MRVKCNMCEWSGDEDELLLVRDDADDVYINACPSCRTDHYLMDIPDSD